MADIHQARSAGAAFAKEHAAALAVEVNEWQDTGFLRGSRLNELAEIVRPFAGTHALQTAESMANRAARDALSAALPAGAQQVAALSDDEIDRLQEEYDCFGRSDAPRIHDFARGVERAVRTLAAPAAAQGVSKGSWLMKRIDAAAEALSEVMAFTKLGEPLSIKVEHALSGLRGLQATALAAATPATEAAPSAKRA